jgi:hypothetical protein
VLGWFAGTLVVVLLLTEQWQDEWQCEKQWTTFSIKVFYEKRRGKENTSAN